MAENMVNEREDSVVSEMIKQLLQEEIHEITRCFQECFCGLGGCSQLLEDRAAGIPAEA